MAPRSQKARLAHALHSGLVHRRAACDAPRRRTQELVCVVVDVSPTMHADLPVVAEAATEYFHKLVRRAAAASAPRPVAAQKAWRLVP